MSICDIVASQQGLTKTYEMVKAVDDDEDDDGDNWAKQL